MANRRSARRAVAYMTSPQCLTYDIDENGVPDSPLHRTVTEEYASSEQRAASSEHEVSTRTLSVSGGVG